MSLHSAVPTRDGYAPQGRPPRAEQRDRPHRMDAARRRPARVRADAGGGRLLLMLWFWSGLATAIELWWLGVDAPTSTGDLATTAGRLAGMVGGYSLLIQILLMSRVPILERWAGAHTLTAWHRRLGALVVVAVLAHLALIVVGYAYLSRTGVVAQGWSMLTDWADVTEAFAAAGLLTVLGLLGFRAVRRAMPHELWYWMHLSAYAVLYLGYAHQFTYGQDLAAGFGRWFWIGLHLLVVGAVGWGRVLRPVLFNARHRLRVAHVVAESADTVSIYVTGRRLDRLGARAGQHLRWRFLTSGCWWQAHPFSLSAAPNGRRLRLTVKAVGGHTDRLQQLREGTRVLISGPAGHFTAAHASRPGALLIAAGSGIAPIRALLEDLAPGAVVVYRARHEADLIFTGELERISHDRGVRIWYVLGSRHDDGPRRLMTARGLRHLVPDIADRDVYLCGPPGLTDTVRAVLDQLGVPRRQIHLDPFSF